jgi:L-alanine-DL-glutamate epimerase-like enolase superfamily enzyme
MRINSVEAIKLKIPLNKPMRTRHIHLEYVEHIDFFPDDFFINDFTIANGKIALPQTPGHGVTVPDRSIQKYQFL